MVNIMAGRGRPKKAVNLFELGFPLHSRSGLQAVDGEIERMGRHLGEKQARAAYYGQRELEALADPLMRQWAAVMGPAEQEITRLRGGLDILHQAALGKADVALLLARQKAEELAGRLGGYQNLTGPTSQGGPYQLPTKPFPTNGAPRPPLATIPFRPPPVGGQGCPPNIVYVLCPACGVQAPCDVNVTAIATAIATAINTTVVNLGIRLSQQQQQSLVNNVTQQVTVDLKVEEPVPLGKDCGHALHVHVCNAPLSCEEGKVWRFAACIDDEGELACPAP